MISPRIFEVINIGLVILDPDLTVRHWNRWMELHSGIPEAGIVGKSLFDHYPGLNTTRFTKNCKSVLTFGNFCFFSQKLHRWLFPFKPVTSFSGMFDRMQQSCTMGPLRDDGNAIRQLFISVQDVTEVAAYERRLVELNTRDPLTGSFNRRFLDSRLPDECERHKRYGRPLSLLMWDIDHFKRVNDTHGHQCGDEVLKSVAAVVGSELRLTDMLIRYGGEEFCCLLPETRMDTAISVAERIRACVEAHSVKCGDEAIRITISVGVGELDSDSPYQEALIALADKALYEAKTSGRNRVVAQPHA